MDKKNHIKLSKLIIPSLIVYFNVLILANPEEFITAAKDGLLLWANNVLPALLPFAIGTNILIATGFISLIGALFEPIMRPIFKVPGCGAFALINGMTSGYPMGAKTTALLRTEGKITRTEAERLISFTNNAGPLFIIGAVGIGMFKSLSIGYFLLICSYTSAIVTGIIFRFYNANKNDVQNEYVGMAFNALTNVRGENKEVKKNIGKILGESVYNGLETVTMVGGFIILFSILVRGLEISNVFIFMQFLFAPIMNVLNITPNIIEGFFVGIMEVTNGVKIISDSPFNELQLMLAAGIIAFGGLSIHAQTANFISSTDIRMGVYFAAKCLQSVISMVICLLIFNFFNFKQYTFSSLNTFGDVTQTNKLLFSTITFVLAICILFAIGIIMWFIFFKKTNKSSHIWMNNQKNL